IGEPRDAGTLQRQLQDAFLAIDGESPRHLHVLHPAVCRLECPSGSARCREYEAAVTRQVLAALRHTLLSQVLRARAYDAPDLTNLVRHQARISGWSDSHGHIYPLGMEINGTVGQ